MFHLRVVTLHSVFGIYCCQVTVDLLLVKLKFKYPDVLTHNFTNNCFINILFKGLSMKLCRTTTKYYILRKDTTYPNCMLTF